MLVPAVNSASRRRAVLLAALMLGVLPECFAQPGNNSPSQFGDRQTGHWGDPGTGYFGNPATGNFDNSVVREPAPGTKPLGRVSKGGKPSEPSPYISLPAPKDAAAEPAASGKTAGAKPGKKKPAAKKKAAS